MTASNLFKLTIIFSIFVSESSFADPATQNAEKIRAKVASVDRAIRRLRERHEDLPAFMDALQMARSLPTGVNAEAILGRNTVNVSQLAN